MSDESILIPIEAQEENFEVFDKAEEGLEDVTAALNKLIETEKRRAASDDAKKIFETMTNAEKEAFTAAYELEQQQKKLEESNKKLIKSGKDAANQNKETAFSWTELRSAYSIVLDVYRAGQQVLEETVGAYDEYAAQVESVSRLTGQNAEESSKLIQVADDLQVSYESLSSSIAKAAKEQDLSIDGLADMSDKYLSLTNANDRASYANEIFGKNYKEMIKILEAGGETIRGLAEDTPEGLILNDKDIQNIKAYRREIDAFQDSLEALKVTVGGEIVSVFNEYNVQMEATRILAEQNNVTILDQHDAQRLWADATDEAKEAAIAQAEAQYYQNQNLEDGTEKAEEMTASLEELSASNQELFGLMGDFDSIADSYVEKTTSLKEQEAELLAQKQALVDSGYSAESQAIQDVNAKLDENIQAQQEAADAAEEATKRRIANLIETKLSADGLTDEELTALLTLNKEWGLMSESAATAAQQVNDAVNNYLTTGNLNDFTSSVEGITDALLQLPEEKTVKIDVELTVNGQPASTNELLGLLAVEP